MTKVSGWLHYRQHHDGFTLNSNVNIVIQSIYSIFFKCAVPAVTPIANLPQAEPNKPQHEHSNKYEEHHALLSPPKAQNKNEKHAKEDKYGKNRYSGNRETTAEEEKEIENEIDTGIKEILKKCGRNKECKFRKGKKCGRNNECSFGKSNKGGDSKARNVKAYRNVGCYKDALPRAVPLLEG